MFQKFRRKMFDFLEKVMADLDGDIFGAPTTNQSTEKSSEDIFASAVSSGEPALQSVSLDSPPAVTPVAPVPGRFKAFIKKIRANKV